MAGGSEASAWSTRRRPDTGLRGGPAQQRDDRAACSGWLDPDRTARRVDAHALHHRQVDDQTVIAAAEAGACSPVGVIRRWHRSAAVLTPVGDGAAASCG